MPADDHTTPRPQPEWHHWAWHPNHGPLIWRTDGLDHRPTPKEVVNQHWGDVPSGWQSGVSLYDPEGDVLYQHSRQGDVPEDVGKTFKSWYPKVEPQAASFDQLHSYPAGDWTTSESTQVTAAMPKLHDGERVMVEPLGVMATVVKLVPPPEDIPAGEAEFAGMTFDKPFSYGNRWYYEIAYTKEDGWPDDGTTMWAEHQLKPVPTGVPEQWENGEREAAAKRFLARELEKRGREHEEGEGDTEPRPVGYPGDKVDEEVAKHLPDQRAQEDAEGEWESEGGGGHYSRQHENFAWHRDSHELQGDAHHGDGLTDGLNDHVWRVTADADHSGAMIALYIPDAAAKKLALEGEDAESAEDLHITLAYFVDKAKDRDDWDVARRVAAEVARSHPSLRGEVAGFGKFKNGDGPVLWASVDIPGLDKLRVELVDKLEGAGFEISQDHGFTPHVTLIYADQEGDDDLIGTKLEFAEIYSVVDDERESHELSAENRVASPP